MQLRSLVLTLLLAASVSLPLAAQALTADDINAQIQALMRQISSLQSSLSTQSAPAPSVQSAPARSSAAFSGSYCPTFSRNLARGASGTEVLSLQRFLLGEGLLTADLLTGTFGPRTESALQEWQAKYSIVSGGTPSTTGFGVLGPRTMRLITLNCAEQTVTDPAENSCPSAPRPNITCSGTWQAISGQSGCTTAWKCTMELPASSVPAPSSRDIAECGYAPRPNVSCGGFWSALTDGNGCTVAWQCAIPIPGLSPAQSASPVSVAGGENALGLYIGYINGMIFTTRTVTRAEALANCRLYASNNPGSAVRCVWQGEDIFNNR